MYLNVLENASTLSQGSDTHLRNASTQEKQGSEKCVGI